MADKKDKSVSTHASSTGRLYLRIDLPIWHVTRKILNEKFIMYRDILGKLILLLLIGVVISHGCNKYHCEQCKSRWRGYPSCGGKCQKTCEKWTWRGRRTTTCTKSCDSRNPPRGWKVSKRSSFGKSWRGKSDTCGWDDWHCECRALCR